MKNRKTVCSMIIDKSGSMNDIKDEVRNSINQTISKMSELDQGDDQEVLMDIRMFNERLHRKATSTNASLLKPLAQLDYEPMGVTALFDAIGVTFLELEKEYLNQPDTHINITVFTDGYENASRVYELRQIQRMISQIQERKNWEFTLVGCDIETLNMADTLGINRSNTVYTIKQDLGASMNAMSSLMEKRVLREEYDVEACYSMLNRNAKIDEDDD